MSVITNSGESEEVKTAEVAADALDPLVGQTLDGRFRIVDVIGKGAMGKVYRAVQLPLNRAVALKVLDSRYGAGREESFKQRFLVEAALTAKLNHPNTVRVLDYGSTKDGLFFLAMEYLDGETLEKTLSGGALPWHRVLSIGQQMARALREAHELGVVHRDLKPANVVMLHADDDNDFVKVLDFGLVKSFVEGQELEGRAITQQGMLMGSPPYMAPEQGERNRADPRSDIYSLGTMLFEMLTGKPPFVGGGALEIILKHVHQPVPPITTPQKFEPPPEALTAIVQKCLAKSPMDRFQSMDELLLAMQDVSVPARAQTQDLPQTEVAVAVVAPAPLEPEPVTTQTKRPVWLLLGGFFVAAVAGVLGTWSIVKPAPPTKLAVHVESAPPGATVFVDGKSLGVTPIELEHGLQNGRGALELRLEKEGFTPVTMKVAGPGGRLELSPVLMPVAPQTVLDPVKAAEEAKLAAKAAEAAKKEEAARAEAEKKAEAARAAEVAKAAEEAKRVAAAKAAEEAKAAEAAKKLEAAKAAEAKKLEAAKAAEAKKLEAAKVAEAKKLEAAKAAEAKRLDAAKASEAKKAADAAKAAEAKKAADAAKASEAKKAADVKASDAARAKNAADAAWDAPNVAAAKKKGAALPPKTEPLAPRPASKLDEDEDTSTPKSELKRPTAQP